MHSTPLAEDEVEIEVRAIGLNFKDCLIALGRVPSDTLGSECAGVVIRVGTAFQDKFRVGDRVCMSTTETFKTYARSKVQTVYRLLSSVSFTEAAAIPTQFGTAWMSIVNISRLQKGETILIHAGAGGIGQASIQISQYVGAEVFVTVSSQNKKQTLMTEYQIPDDHVFYSRDTSFAMGIKHATNGRGVDVVLNSLAGDSLLASWESLAPFGRFVEIGKKDILENASLPMLPFHKSVTFSAFDGSVWLAERRDEAERVIATIMDLFEKNIFHCARPLNLYPISHIQKAFSEIANGKNSGKIVLDVRSEAIVPVSFSIFVQPLHFCRT
jgi:NADPH:quinone reductase-like Zn-dependent oxidoreductase